jgi:hypothetical protein
MLDKPQIVPTGAQLTAIIRLTIPRAAGPESSPDPAAWRTELNRPLARADER